MDVCVCVYNDLSEYHVQCIDTSVNCMSQPLIHALNYIFSFSVGLFKGI